MSNNPAPPAATSWPAHFRAALTLGLPLIGSHLAQMLTSTTDVIMLGWYGVIDLAAAVLATQIYIVVLLVGSGFAFAVMPIVATALGEDDDQTVRRSVRMGVYISMAYAATLMVPLWFFEPLLLFLGQEKATSALAQDYMRIAQWSMFPALMIMVIRSYFVALERAQIVLWATLFGAAANAVFNYAFIFGNFGAPEMGARGAALASLLTMSVTCVFLLVYAASQPALKKYRLFDNPFNADWAALRMVFLLGAPIGLTMFAEASLFAATSVMMGWIDTIALAAHGIVMQITAFLFMIPLGLSNVATVRAGRALGRKDLPDLWRGAVAILSLGAVFSMATIILLLTSGEAIVVLFLDQAAPEFTQIVTFALTLLLVAAIFQFTDAMQVIAMALLRGIKDTAMPMVLAIISYWLIGLPTGYILGFHLGYGGPGIWMGLVFGLNFAAVTLVLRFLSKVKRLK